MKIDLIQDISLQKKEERERERSREKSKKEKKSCDKINENA